MYVTMPFLAEALETLKEKPGTPGPVGPAGPAGPPGPAAPYVRPTYIIVPSTQVFASAERKYVGFAHDFTSNATCFSFDDVANWYYDTPDIGVPFPRPSCMLKSGFAVSRFLTGHAVAVCQFFVPSYDKDKYKHAYVSGPAWVTSRLPSALPLTYSTHRVQYDPTTGRIEAIVAFDWDAHALTDGSLVWNQFYNDSIQIEVTLI